MILKKEYKLDNVIKSTIIDNIDKIDSGVLDDGTSFINVYKKDRQKQDEFETIEIKSLNVYLMNDSGQTLQIFRSK